MTNNHADYNTIDDQPQTPTESIYTNPVFDDHNEDKEKLPLLNDILLRNNGEDSPYEEVAVNVSNKDDQTMLCLTFRSLFIGILLTCLTSFTTQFFTFRTSPLDVNVGIIILLSYMIGQLMASILPENIFNGVLNPGPFSSKEHALITIMATSATATVDAVESLTVQRLYYKFYLAHINAILCIIIMHLLAFSMAGILKRYLVWPSSMIWPKTLMACCLIRALAQENTNDELKEINTNRTRWTMTRSRFFWLVVFFQFLWYWLPGYIFPLLSFFSFVCMIAPSNIALAQVTGANGLGLGAIQFDWNAWVAYLDSPILVPFWAHVNFFIGFVIVAWILTPIVYYSDLWESQKMPIVSNRVFDVNGYFYNATKILDENLQINDTAYKIYGEIRLSALYAISWGFVFAGLVAVIVHTALYHGKLISEQFRSRLSDATNDIHAKLMSYYPEVPDWWYSILLISSFIFGSILCYMTHLVPVYGMISSIVLAFIMLLPMGILQATTNISFSLGVPGDILGGFILRGNPIGFLTFRTYFLGCNKQSIIYLTNYKIGHYMKIPPRILFFTMLLCSIIASVVNYLTALYLLNHIPNICTSKNSLWKCLNLESTYTVSVIWGVIGGVKVFGPHAKYSAIVYGIFIGPILPIISWYLWKKFPHIKWLAFVNFPIILLATNNIPPAPAAEYPSWFLVGFIFNCILYRYAHVWWEKYAYIFSAAMSCGVAICGFLIFFVLQNNNIYFPKWWGTGGPMRDGCPLASANYSGVIPTD